MNRAIWIERITPHLRQGGIWWSERNLREQILIGGLLALLAFSVLLLAVIRPLQDVRAQALSDIRSADVLAARLQAGGPAVGGLTRTRRGTPSAIVTESVAAAGLAVQRIQPEGTGQRVVLGDAPFDAVIRWVADLEASSTLRVTQARIEQRPAPGVVSAQFLIDGGIDP